MPDSTAVIEMIRRIVADDTADLRERIQHLEGRKGAHDQDRSVDYGSEFDRSGDHGSVVASDVPVDSDGELLRTEVAELQARLDQIKDLHKLDATPVQWTRDPSTNKMVEAPEGLWEISCLACKHQTVWQQGNKQPPQCPTWLLATGSDSKKP